MKKVSKYFLSAILIFNCILLSACSFGNFTHTKVAINPNDERYQFEVFVKEANYGFIYDNGLGYGVLDVVVDIKYLAEGGLAFAIDLQDFDFYLTQNITVYKTCMFLHSYSNRKNEVVHFSVKPRETITIFLSIHCGYSKDIPKYVVKLWNQRI